MCVVGCVSVCVRHSNEYFIFIEIQYLEFNIISTYFVYFNNYLEFKKFNHVTSRPKG